MADNTAAEIMPAKIGPNNLSLTKNRTVSGLETVEYITFAVNPNRIIPEKMINAQNIAIYLPLLIVLMSFAAMNRFTTKGCPGYPNPILIFPMMNPIPSIPAYTPVKLFSSGVPIASKA